MAQSLALSDGLEDLAGMFVDYEHEPRILDPEDARQMRTCLIVLRKIARAYENAASQDEWNRRARLEQEERDREASLVMKAISTPGSKVVLFPVIPRPFS